MAKPRGEMSPEELALKETEDFATGPMSVLTNAANNQVLIALRNNKKILGRIKAFDRHANMVLKGAKFLWTKTDKGKKKAMPVAKARFVGKVFLRGDSVIIIVKNPLADPSIG